MYLERVHQAFPTTLVVLVPLSLENVNCQFVIVSCHNVHKMTYNYAVYDVTLMLSFAVLVLILSVVIFISPNVVNKLIIIFYVCLEKKMKILPCQKF